VLRLLAFRIEPDAELGTGRHFLTDGVHVLVPRNRLARQNEFAGAVRIPVVTLADSPFHEIGPGVDKVLRIVRGAAAAGRDALVDGFRIVLQHEMRDRVMEDLASLHVRRADFDHPHPARLVEAGNVGRRTPPLILAHRRHLVLG
jgi:hypothetical protein